MHDPALGGDVDFRDADYRLQVRLTSIVVTLIGLTLLLTLFRGGGALFAHLLGGSPSI